MKSTKVDQFISNKRNSLAPPVNIQAIKEQAFKTRKASIQPVIKRKINNTTIKRRDGSQISYKRQPAQNLSMMSGMAASIPKYG